MSAEIPPRCPACCLSSALDSPAPAPGSAGWVGPADLVCAGQGRAHCHGQGRYLSSCPSTRSFCAVAEKQEGCPITPAHVWSCFTASANFRRPMLGTTAQGRGAVSPLARRTTKSCPEREDKGEGKGFPAVIHATFLRRPGGLESQGPRDRRPPFAPGTGTVSVTRGCMVSGPAGHRGCELP